MKSSQNNIQSVEETLAAIMPEGKLDGKLPPVHLWSPENTTDIGMEIRADGSWWHDGARIRRQRLVRLFSRVLRKDEDGETYLVTPYEKVIVHIEDAPFLAIRVDRAGEPGPEQTLIFTTNLGDVALAGSEAPLRVETDNETDEPSPYVTVRSGLEAKLTRPVFYELAQMAVPNSESASTLGVWSDGIFFEIGQAS